MLGIGARSRDPLNFSQPKYLHLDGLVAVKRVGVIRLLIFPPGLDARRRSPR